MRLDIEIVHSINGKSVSTAIINDAWSVSMTESDCDAEVLCYMVSRNLWFISATRTQVWQLPPPYDVEQNADLQATVNDNIVCAEITI